jgi:hypothetical protein
MQCSSIQMKETGSWDCFQPGLRFECWTQIHNEKVKIWRIHCAPKSNQITRQFVNWMERLKDKNSILWNLMVWLFHVSPFVPSWNRNGCFLQEILFGWVHIRSHNHSEQPCPPPEYIQMRRGKCYHLRKLWLWKEGKATPEAVRLQKESGSEQEPQGPNTSRHGKLPWFLYLSSGICWFSAEEPPGLQRSQLFMMQPSLWDPLGFFWVLAHSRLF